MFQAAGDEGKHDERCVNTLLVDVVSRLRQWNGVGRRDREGGRGTVQVWT